MLMILLEKVYAMTKTLGKFGFDRLFVKKNLVSITIDGHYVKCRIKKHLKNV